jgi:SMODS and SLOG-associating 2TM effector domain family 4
MNPDIEPILATARDLYGRVVYTHETHERERIIWSNKVCQTNRINTALASATTVLAVISAALPATWVLILTAIAAGSTTAFGLWQSSSDAANKENQHRIAAKELLWCRQQLAMLIADCHIPLPVETLRRNLEIVNREVHAIYKFAPNTSPEAYNEAERKIKGGHFSFSDDELDALLPESLRKNRKSPSP